MSNWKAVGILVAALAPAPAAAYLPPHGNTAANKKLTIDLDGDAVILGGKKFTLPLEEKELTALWGKPDRTAELANRILTWDELGIYAYVRPKESKVHALAVAYSKHDLSFWPKKNFAGKLTIDGADVTAKSTIQAIDKAKKGAAFEKSLLPDTWKVMNKKTSIYVRHRPDPTEGLIDVEVGVDPDAK